MIIRTLFIAFILGACTNGVERSEAPENLIPRDDMVEVLTELTKLEAAIQIKYVSIDKYHNAMRLSGDSVLNAHNVTYDAFDKSMEYYAVRQDEMIGLYSEVLDVLTKELGEIEDSEQ